MSQGSSKDSGTNSGTSGFHDNRETADCTPDTGTGVHHSTTLKPLIPDHNLISCPCTQQVCLAH